MLLSGAAEQFRIVGLFGFGDHDRLRRGDLRGVRPRDRAARVRRRASVDAVYVQRDPGVPTAVLRQRIETAVGPGFVVAHTGGGDPRASGRPVRQFLGFFTDALLGLRGHRRGGRRLHHLQHVHDPRRPAHPRARVAPGDGRDGGPGRAFRGASKPSSWVWWRRRSGCSRASALGVGLLDLLRALGLELPATSTVVLGRTVVVSLVVGVVVTVVAAAMPAIRAARVPPVAAIADVPPRAPVGGFARRVVAGAGRARGLDPAIAAYGLARAATSPGIFEQVQVVALGAFAVLVGVVLVLPAVVRPAVRDRSARRCAASARRARWRARNAMRNPRRTAITASALVIGLALVGLTATFGASARASVGRETGVGPARRLRGEDRRLRRASPPRWRHGCATSRVSTTVVPMRFADARGRRRHEDGRQHRPGDPGQVVDLGFVRGGAERPRRRRCAHRRRARPSPRCRRRRPAARCSSRAGQLPLTVRGDLPAPELHRPVRPVGAAVRRAGDASTRHLRRVRPRTRWCCVRTRGR